MQGLKPAPDPLPARWRVWWGSFRVFEGKQTVPARASFQIAKREQVSINLFLETFRSGRFPYFKQEHREEGYTVRIPAGTILRMAEYIKATNARARYQEGRHKWGEKFIDLSSERRRLRRDAANIAQRLKASHRAFKAGDLRQAMALYREAHEEFKAKRDTLKDWERERLLPPLKQLREWLLAAQRKA